ncbi:MAG TPA: beta galactosidase jelly roll domain-containing protein, partial [Candidatus Lokiarchaeia archaeon]|nr:beta galactosidase jelly roll domain-containing protein [Candidatus Lokiarchaeia archaeon]
SPYQKMLVETFAAEGATAMSLYMFYGGTNYGAIGDPEVYTSYDYSACLREYGYQSDRLRFLRQFALFAQSFGESFTSTDVIPPPAKGDQNLAPLTCSVPGIFYRHRRSVIDGTDYFFLRNFNKTGAEKFHVVLPGGIRVPKEGLLALSPRESFIAVGNCPLGQYTIKFSSIPIITKGSYAGGTMLVLTHNGGEILLQGTGYTVSGDAQATAEDLYTRIFFLTPGYAVVKSPQEEVLYLICLSHADALTLNVGFSKPDLRVAWGAYSVFFNPAGQLELETMGQQEVWLALPDLVVEDFSLVTDVPVPGLQRGLFGSDISVPDAPFSTWERHATDSANDPDVWKEIDFAKERDAVDHRYLSGHVLYKCEFTAPPGPKLRLKLTIRHKAGVWLNGQFIGGHATYGIGILSQGAMQGPDRGGDARKYDLSPVIKWGGSNVLFILVEMLGQNKQPYVINDARAPRGILQAKFSTQTKDTKWFIAGIDVSTLDDPYNTAGLPGEKHNFHIGQGDGWEPCAEPIHITPNDQIAWFKTQFECHAEDNTRIPLHLHVDGLANASIFLNGQFVARYWGEAGPQHDFYLMDGFLQDGVNDLVLACWTTQETNIGLSVLPYKVKLESGNIDDEAGTIFATRKTTISI